MISIAIDGPSGAGKSTISRKAAEKFGFIYVDTGAIYRTIGLATKIRGVSLDDTAAVVALLPTLEIELKYNDAGEQHSRRRKQHRPKNSFCHCFRPFPSVFEFC